MITRPKRLFTVGAVLSLTLLALGCGVPSRAGSTGHPAAAAASNVNLDPQGGSVFGPPAPTATPALSASQAWADFIKNDTDGSGTTLPAGVTTSLGLLTIATDDNGPQSDWTYRMQGVLAYGFESNETCSSLMNGSSYDCYKWTFVDANTGAFLDERSLPTPAALKAANQQAHAHKARAS